MESSVLREFAQLDFRLLLGSKMKSEGKRGFSGNQV